MARSRYVVLYHHGIAEPHFDLMILLSASDATLATWRLSAWPIGEQVPLVRLPDHRKHYLDYEGPVGHDRGFVTRVAGGDCEVSGSPRTEVQVQLLPSRSVLRIRRQVEQWVASMDDWDRSPRGPTARAQE